MRNSRRVMTALLIGSLMLSAGQVMAAEKSSKSSKSGAAVGNKELLARIELLEQALASLQGSSGVAGGEYRLFTLANAIGLLNAPGTGSFEPIGSRVHTVQFNTDNTGLWTRVECTSNQLSVFGGTPQIQSSPGCTGLASITFTYVQAGGLLEITFTGAPAPMLMTVNSDASVIGGATGGTFGDPSVPGGVNGVVTNMSVGLRVSP